MSPLNRREAFIIGAIPAAERIYAKMGAEQVTELIGSGPREKKVTAHQGLRDGYS